MDESLVSIIVPVYNAENYLRRCVDSLLSQTYKNIEILLINDGSKDKSGIICDTISKEDYRVKVFHQENQGVSAARQFGLNQANGKYVIHVDPDDWVEVEMIEQLYLKASAEDADMVICDYYKDYANRSIYVTQKPESLVHTDVLKDLFLNLHGACWNKLVKKDCFIKYDVRFPQGISYCEDLYTNVSLLCNPLKIAYLPKAYYHYDQYTNPSSLARVYDRSSLSRDISLLGIFEKVVSKLEDSEISDVAKSFFSYLIVIRASQSNSISRNDFRAFVKPHIKDILPVHLKAASNRLYVRLSKLCMPKLTYAIHSILKRLKKC